MGQELTNVVRGLEGFYSALEDANRIYNTQFPNDASERGPVNTVYRFLQKNLPDVSEFDLNEAEGAFGLEAHLKSLRSEQARYAKRTLDVSKRTILNMTEGELDTEQIHNVLKTILDVLYVFDDKAEQVVYMNTFSGMLKADTRSKVMPHIVVEGLYRLLSSYKDQLAKGEENENVLKAKFRNTLNALLVAGGTVQMQYYQRDPEIEEKDIQPSIAQHTTQILKTHFNGY